MRLLADSTCRNATVSFASSIQLCAVSSRQSDSITTSCSSTLSDDAAFNPGATS